MMYILSQEEFDELQEKASKITEDAQKLIQEMCFRIADSEIVEEGVGAGRPWGCVYFGSASYCDNCPVRKICTKNKRYSR